MASTVEVGTFVVGVHDPLPFLKEWRHVDVSLLMLTKEDREECAGLGVGEDQQGFVDPNLFCIAKARFEPGREPLAVYRGATMVVPGVRIAGTCVASTV